MGAPTPAIVGVDKEIAGRSNQFYWSEGFDKIKPSSVDAADFIISNLKKYPNEIIIFTVGPVCNIKEVIDKDKGVLKLAKKVVSMFGSFHMGYNGGPVPDAEWNVRADIEASKIYAASNANKVYAGLDVTTFVKLNEANRNRLLMRQSLLTNALCGCIHCGFTKAMRAPIRLSMTWSPSAMSFGLNLSPPAGRRIYASMIPAIH